MFNFLKSLEASRSPKNVGASKMQSQKHQISKISSYQQENSPYQIDLAKRGEKLLRADRNNNLIESQAINRAVQELHKEGAYTAGGGSNKYAASRENGKQRTTKTEQTVGAELAFQVPSISKTPLTHHIENIINNPGRDLGSRNLCSSIQQEKPNFQGIKMKTLTENKSVDSLCSHTQNIQSSSQLYEQNCSYEEDLRNSSIYLHNTAKQSCMNTSQHYFQSQYSDAGPQKISVLSNSYDQSTIKSSGSREEVVKSLSDKINVLNSEIKGLEELNQNLNNDVTYWSKAFESMRKKYADLVEQSSSMQRELENLKQVSRPVCTKNEIKQQNAMAFTKPLQPNTQHVNQQQKCIQQQRIQIQRENEEKIRVLEAEKRDWKDKCQKLEKDHLQEIEQLKSVASADTEINEEDFKENANPEERRISELKLQLQALLGENEKLNLITSQLFEEIRLKKEKNPLLVERDAFIKGLILKLANDRDDIESANQEEIIRLTKEIEELSSVNEGWVKEIEERDRLMIEYYDDNEENYVGSLTEEKRVEFLISENKKLEEQIESWQSQFQALEKKVEQNKALKHDLKYTEDEVNSILSKLSGEHSKEEEMLRERLSRLEHDIEETKKQRIQKKPQAKLRIQSARDNYSGQAGKKKQNENAFGSNFIMLNHKGKK